MQNIFLQTYREEDQLVFIEGKDCHHLKNVLRIKKGDIVEAVLGQKKARLLVFRIEKKRIICTVADARKITDGGHTNICVYQGYLKAWKMDFLVARLAELGVRTFVPIITGRSIPRGDTGVSRIERWRRLSREGAKVSGSEEQMEISPPVFFADACRSLNKTENEVIIIFCAGDSGLHIKPYLESISAPDISFHLFFGPEGGFTADEVQTVKNAGGEALTMGNFIMKSDTAALVGTGFIRTYYSEMVGK